jgi:hypothetical protein
VTARDDLLAALDAERFTPTPPHRILPPARVERLPVDAVAVIEHHRAAAARNDAARAERAYRRAARLAAAVHTETPTATTPDDDHAARLLAGVTKEPTR